MSYEDFKCPYVSTLVELEAASQVQLNMCRRRDELLIQPLLFFFYTEILSEDV